MDDREKEIRQLVEADGAAFREEVAALDEEGFTSLTLAVLDNGIAPKPVRKMAADIRRATGRVPEITRPEPNRWLVALTGSRVAVTVDYETRLGGKTRYAGSVLAVDGKQRPLVSGPAEFGQLWHRLENPHRRPELTRIPPVPPGVVMPADVRMTLDEISGKVPADVAVEAGYQAGRWIIGITLAPDRGLRLFFHRHGRSGSSWHPQPGQFIQVIAGGKDLSAQVGQDVAAAIALLIPSSAPESPPAPGSPGMLGRGARDQGIETRKRVVIREYRRPSAPFPSRVPCRRELY